MVLACLVHEEGDEGEDDEPDEGAELRVRQPGQVAALAAPDPAPLPVPLARILRQVLRQVAVPLLLRQLGGRAPRHVQHPQLACPASLRRQLLFLGDCQ